MVRTWWSTVTRHYSSRLRSYSIRRWMSSFTSFWLSSIPQPWKRHFWAKRTNRRCPRKWLDFLEEIVLTSSSANTRLKITRTGIRSWRKIWAKTLMWLIYRKISNGRHSLTKWWNVSRYPSKSLPHILAFDSDFAVCIGSHSSLGRLTRHAVKSGLCLSTSHQFRRRVADHPWYRWCSRHSKIRSRQWIEFVRICKVVLPTGGVAQPSHGFCHSSSWKRLSSWKH